MLVLNTKKVQFIKDIAKDPSKGAFVITPLEPGYGTTIGNSLRRVLYSSIEGYAITHIKLPAGVLHEFAPIEGVVEDMSEIILNLKQVRFKKINSLTEEEKKITIHIKGQDIFAAKDIEKHTTAFKILNPELAICHMEPTVDISFDLILKKGKGYMVASKDAAENDIVGQVPIDATFSPIKNVKIQVKNTLIGQRTDYEELSLTIETDGSITAEEALKQTAQNLVAHFSLFCDKKGISAKENEEGNNIYSKDFLRMRQLLNTRLDELNLSSRVYNSLSDKKIKKLGDIAMLRKNQIMKFKSFGKKSIAEIEDLLKEKGISFDMDVAKYKLEQSLEN